MYLNRHSKRYLERSENQEREFPRQLDEIGIEASGRYFQVLSSRERPPMNSINGCGVATFVKTSAVGDLRLSKDCFDLGLTHQKQLNGMGSAYLEISETNRTLFDVYMAEAAAILDYSVNGLQD